MTHQAKFDIRNASGETIYTNMIRDEEIHGYSWGDGYGFITDSQIKAEKWKAVSANYPGTDVPVSSVLKLDRMRLEARISELEEIQASGHTIRPNFLEALKTALSRLN